MLSVGNELCKYADDTCHNPEPTPINDNDCVLKPVPTLLAHTELVDSVAVPAQTELVDCVDSDNTAAMNDNDSLLSATIVVMTLTLCWMSVLRLEIQKKC